jgi:Na+-driven multidrug efflux pump
VFVSYDPRLYDMTVRGFMIYALSFLFAGFNLFGSSMFTALNNGLVSAVLSFFRTLIFQTGAVLLLPLALELDGVWLSVAVGELGAAVLTVICMIRYRKRYHYA